ncbi:MAG: SpaA isopeptide-forming pilin-related protein [Bifidobacterium sp.]|uniref:SpaA isopeptide-forming pilin-related protein n=1 Tax=Bifidobacterium fermentum TaxID=3059035 RepID=A0AB39ULL5_9BIFI
MKSQNHKSFGQDALRHLYAIFAVVAMLATAGIVASLNPQRAEAATTTALSCATGNFYTVTSNGSVYRVTASGDVVNTALSNTGISFPVANRGDINGLAIGSSGSTAFAFERTSSTVAIKRWDASTGAVQSSAFTTLTKPSNLSFSASDLIAGGINPTDSNGYYYFGGFGTSNTGANSFLIWKANPTTFAVSFVGYISLPSDVVGTNGDLAFDQSGNLYVLSSSGSANHIIGVTTSALSAASGASIPYASRPSIDGSGLTYNGMAFSNTGTVYVQGQSNSVTRIGVTDPTQGGEPTQTYRVRDGSNDIDGVDLASCQTPPTIQALKKNVVARYDATDQFTLSITPLGSSAASATATTSGSIIGPQNEVAGPVIAVPGSTYVLEEVGAGSPTADLSKYSSSLSCIDANNGGAAVAVTPVAGSTTKYTMTIPTNTVAAISCTFTNKAVQKLWNFYLQKYGPQATSSTSPTALDGASFEILSDSGNQPGSVLATYNPTAVSGQTGKFSVSNIPEGTYWLREANVPTGYDGLASPVQFKVNSDGTVALTTGSSQVSVVTDQTGKVFTLNVSDPQKPGVELPNTGGEGTVMYLLIGLFVLFGGIAGSVLTKRIRPAR